MIEYADLWLVLAVVVAYLLDLLLGDPIALPHPVVYFGRMISFSEHRLNKGSHRLLKGLFSSVGLIVLVYLGFYWLMFWSQQVGMWLNALLTMLFFFYGLANKTLIKEGVDVFKVLEKSGIEAGRRQLSRIVGRDTSQLSEQQVRKAALETMAENLSDGVVAPVFWFILLGVPGMMAYKMINTLDSMIGYKNERYLLYGRAAAYIDDAANYLPARITALLMSVVRGSVRAMRFVVMFGNKHSSPNAGYPEAALAGILDVKFGGPNIYHGRMVDKPFIGINERPLKLHDVYKTARVNHWVCFCSILLCIVIRYIILQ
ncbi:cobalamin biosynthesis protein CobD [Carboxylicivirga mesophila]|uniref:Cobalamin biosynthesis protein CobD n=1 Tax=Carboxylicivirga mesophila TaxID=1166478 RepID=A0ABS5KDC8_9BACT|nr:adenosylcobinamide-phosphate synthase CbiB [Carboxylicivirga mesophila]MBS2212966.1 cobalamin biosynthesis protein CobD [Carboxylicivirga mesophila]